MANGVALVLLVARAEAVQHEGERLPQGAHDEHPGIALAQHGRGDHVGQGEQAEDDGGSHGGGRVRKLALSLASQSAFLYLSLFSRASPPNDNSAAGVGE